MPAATKRKSPRKAGGSKRRARSKPHAGVRPPAQRAKAPATARHPPVDPDRYPNLAALEAWDREMHIRSAMGMGLTRKEAERHVEEELAGGHLG